MRIMSNPDDGIRPGLRLRRDGAAPAEILILALLKTEALIEWPRCPSLRAVSVPRDMIGADFGWRVVEQAG